MKDRLVRCPFVARDSNPAQLGVGRGKPLKNYSLFYSSLCEQGRCYIGGPGIFASNKKLLGAPGLTARSRTLLGAPGIATGNKKLLGAPGPTTRSKDATRGSTATYSHQIQ